MKVSDVLSSLSSQSGAETLKGAVVLIALDRPIDHLIQSALSFGPYHRGQKSPWSHTLLLADTYSGPKTPILDFTIRDGSGAVGWDERIDEVLKTGLAHSGGIYAGHVEDSDHCRPLIEAHLTWGRIP